MVNHVLKYGLVAVFCVLLTLLESSPAEAFSKSANVGNGKVCRVMFKRTHMHRGHSGAQASRAAAKAAAVKRWVRFTAWEYGPAWAHFGRARSKSFTCKHRQRAWRCKVAAQPCLK